MQTVGKTIIYLGDSITEGAGASCAEANWVSLVTQEGQFAQGHNFGVGGTRMAVQRQEFNVALSETFCSRVDRMPEQTDCVLIFGGTNDYGHGDAPMGRFGDTDPQTFYGAVDCLLSKLLTKYPTARIALLTPIHRADEHNLVNDRGIRTVAPFYDYVVAEKQVAQKYGIPVLDLYSESGICPEHSINCSTYTVDGLHPNDRGQRLIADKVLNFLKYQL